MKCFDKRNNKIIHIGNLIKHQQMLREHIESDHWTATRYGAIKSNGEPLWKTMFSLVKLKAEYHRYQEAGVGHIWMAEMMNMPSPAGSGLITSSDIILHPGPQPGGDYYGCVTIDPAFSSNRWANKCCLYAHVFYDEVWHSAEHIAEKGLDPFGIFNKAVELCTRWGLTVIGIESVQFQAVLKPMFEYWAIQYNIHYLKFFNINDSKVAKTPRLYGWASMIRAGDYLLNESDTDVMDQLLAYNPNLKDNDDDIIDAGSFIVEMTEQYHHEMMNTFDLNAKEVRVINMYELERQSSG